ncbi:MAG: HAD hydrolase-like protein [Planctomycetota bacterium]
MLKPAVFLDRDSTLNQRVYDEVQGALTSPLQVERVSLRRNAAELVLGLNRMGYLCLVLSSQPELATRRLTAVRLDRIHQKLRKDLACSGAHLDGIFYSVGQRDLGPSWRVGGDGDGDGRPDAQPQSLLIDAASVHQVDLRRSFVVSDRLVDMAAGRAAGTETILLRAASEDLQQALALEPEARPDHVAKDLPAALRIIQSVREATLR